MFKAFSITAGAVVLALTLTGCFGGAANLTLKEAQAKIEAAGIPCTDPQEQALDEVIPHDEGTIGGSVMFCADEGAQFGLGVFDNPKDIGKYLDLVCASATDEATITQLEEYEMLWGPNWFADASANPDIYADLQKALGGELAKFYSKCPAE